MFCDHVPCLVCDRRLLSADPPVIVEEPRDQKVPYSEAAAFFCRARGDPAPVITWWRNGEPLQPSLVVEFPQGKGFWVEPVRRTTDEGDYECVAENGVGDPVRAKASLTVIGGRWCGTAWVECGLMVWGDSCAPAR